MKMKNIISLIRGNGEEDEDHFKRFPDELIISYLFDKTVMPSASAWCSLVCKRFSSLVYQTRTVSLRIPQQQLICGPSKTCFSLPLPEKFLKIIATNFRTMIRWLFGCIVLTEGFTAVDDLESLIPSITQFLGKFTSMTSLYMEIDYSGRDQNDAEFQLIKWKFDFTTFTLVLLVARSCLDLNDVHVDLIDDDVVINDDLVEFSKAKFCELVENVVSWLSLIKELLPPLPETLQNVVVTYSKKQGKLDIGVSVFTGMRNQHTDFAEKLSKARFWYAPVIKLPFQAHL